MTSFRQLWTNCSLGACVVHAVLFALIPKTIEYRPEILGYGAIVIAFAFAVLGATKPTLNGETATLTYIQRVGAVVWCVLGLFYLFVPVMATA